MKKKKVKQIGNTCGFFSLAYCLNDLSPLNDFIEFVSNMVEKCIEDGTTMIGEVFDIDDLLKIANKNFLEMKNIQVTRVEIKTASNISEALEKNRRVVFPIVNGKEATPHYISLLSSFISPKWIKCYDGGYYHIYTIKKLYKLNKSLPNEYDWSNFVKKYRNNKSFKKMIKKQLKNLSDRELAIYLEKNIPNILKKLDKLEKREPDYVNMKGWCLQIEMLEDKSIVPSHKQKLLINVKRFLKKKLPKKDNCNKTLEVKNQKATYKLTLKKGKQT